MLLALVTGQRRSDIAKMRFSDIRDGYLHIEQSKTGSRIALPLALRCNAPEMTLSDVVSICRDKVLSPYLIHHNRPHGTAKAGDPLDENSLSRYFSESRNIAGIKITRQ